MAIEERVTNARGDWEVRATGKDIPKLAGSLTKTANEAYRKAFHENEGKFVSVTDPNGNPTHVHQKDLETALSQGYGKVAYRPSMVVPELPWQPKRFGPGKHKWKYNRETGQMEEA